MGCSGSAWFMMRTNHEFSGLETMLTLGLSVEFVDEGGRDAHEIDFAGGHSLTGDGVVGDDLQQNRLDVGGAVEVIRVDTELDVFIARPFVEDVGAAAHGRELVEGIVDEVGVIGRKEVRKAGAGW